MPSAGPSTLLTEGVSASPDPDIIGGNGAMVVSLETPEGEEYCGWGGSAMAARCSSGAGATVSARSLSRGVVAGSTSRLDREGVLSAVRSGRLRILSGCWSDSFSGGFGGSVGEVRACVEAMNRLCRLAGGGIGPSPGLSLSGSISEPCIRWTQICETAGMLMHSAGKERQRRMPARLCG